MLRLFLTTLACLCVLQARADKIVLVTENIELKEPFGTAFDAAGNMWVIEMASGNRLLKIDDKGVFTHVAGQPKPGFSGDGGPALQAQFNGPHLPWPE